MLSACDVGHPDHRSERKGPMRARHPPRVQPLAARRDPASMPSTIPRGCAHLGHCALMTD
jgi:hypothetical protein